MTRAAPGRSALALLLLSAACSDQGLNPLGQDPESGHELPPYEEPDPGYPDPGAVDTGDFDTGDGEIGWGDDDPGEPLPCTGAVRSVRLQLDFPARAGCGFGSGDNLPAVDAYVQAHHTQIESFVVGDDATVCDIRFEFAASQGGLGFPLRYDDQLLFALNDRVIFASDARMVNPLPRDAEGFAIYDWSAVRGLAMDFSPTPWSVGEGDVIDLPSHDVSGDAFLQIDDDALQAFRGVADGHLDFSLVSFGDNDRSDCGHTGMSFWVELDVEQR